MSLISHLLFLLASASRNDTLPLAVHYIETTQLGSEKLGAGVCHAPLIQKYTPPHIDIAV